MKKLILYFTFFLLIWLTFPLPVTAQIVNILDDNLRAKIEDALGKASGATITAADMAKLTHLEARNANIGNLTGLEHATNLTTLNLYGERVEGRLINSNSVSDISPVAGLTNLTSLALGHNSILDISPLLENTGLGSRSQVFLNGNPLSYPSIKTHIPALQSRGVTVEFDDVTDLNFGEPHMVRLIYFLPSDRSPQQDIDTRIDTLIRDVQQFYANEMGRHGFGRKTFTFETDTTGKTVVHRVDGKFTDSYYRQDTFHKVWEEIREQFYTPQNIYFIAIDSSNERVGHRHNEVCGVGESHGASGGHVLIPASGDCFNLRTAAHELRHAFGLQHDLHSDIYITSFGKASNKLSECAAEWLDAHRYFNTGQSQTHFDNPTKIQMLPPLASPPYAIRLRFEVTDPDGVHQARLLTLDTIRKQERWQPKLLNCKRLNGETDTIEIEFITSQLTVDSREVTLSVIDVHGNITSQMYPIDITTILPTETVSTPNKNQVINIPDPVPPPLAVRQAFELDPFYQQWVDVKGFPVVASEKVNPYALKEAAWLIWQMIGHRPDVLQALLQKRARFSVMAHNELTIEIPEYSDSGPDFSVCWGRGSGGSGASELGYVVSSTEENLMHYPNGGGSYSVTIHEFAHGVHLYGLNTIDPTFDGRLEIAYNAAVEKRLWQGTNASSNRKEYWAEATQGWFNGGGSFNNYGNTRQALKAYDPGIATLLAEVYGDSDWRYTPPTARIHLLHLQGFDPQDSPTFQGWPELEAVCQQLRNPSSDGGGRWVDLRPYDPSLLSSLNESRTAGPFTTVAFINLTQAGVLFSKVEWDGTEYFGKRVPIYPGEIRLRWGRANDIWVIKDSNGKNLALFQAKEKTGRAFVGPTLHLITPGLSKVSGDNQSGVPGAVIANPFVIEVRDENLSTLEGISVTFAITAGGGTLNVTRTTTDKNGAAQSTLTLGQTPGTNVVSVSAAGIEGTVTFNAVVEAAVNIPDSNLRTAIETALSKAESAPITPSEMATLTRLEASEAGIKNLTGLESATNLTHLDFWKNAISDISPVARLTQLTFLDLTRNSVSNIAPIANLTKLTHLDLDRNAIMDHSILSNLTNLIELDLRGTNTSDLSVLAGLTKLKRLYIDSNEISNLSPLAGLNNLTNLGLNYNAISDLSPLRGLTNLGWLRFVGNNITDLSPLVANTGLGEGDWIDVRENPLNAAAIKVHIPALQSRGVTVEFDNRLEMEQNKITGPWLWVIAPTAPGQGGRQSNDVDSLAAASGGDVTEADVAANGAKEGDAVGNYVWTLGRIAATGGNNVNDVINGIGMAQGDVDDHSSYALITLESVTAQSNVTMQVGSDDSIKVWLNGEVVHNKPVNRGASDFQDSFKVNLKKGDNLLLVKVSERDGAWSMFVGIDADVNAVYKRPADVVVSADVNSDGNVNVLDLVVIASALGNAGTNPAVDVNRDGVVSVLDLILVAGMFDGAAAAPSAQPQVPETLTAVEVQGWLTDAKALEVRDPIMKRGFAVLEQLLISLTPKETELLPNYPNPLNPETWIPYRLAEDAFVTLTIYDTVGQIVRTLEIGHRIASAYENRSNAIYWDGRNDVGERMASGVYFYTLSAGEYFATRRMLIIK